MPRVSSSDQHRDNMLRAAALEFIESGYSGATMSTIARRLGVTKGALSYHFPNKIDFAKSMLDHETELLDCAQRSAAEVYPQGGIKALLLFLAFSNNAFLTDPVIAAARFLYPHSAVDDITDESGFDRWCARIETYIAQAVDAGECPDTIVPRTAAENVIVTLFGAAHFIVQHPNRHDMSQPFRFTELALRGAGIIGPDKSFDDYLTCTSPSTSQTWRT